MQTQKKNTFGEFGQGIEFFQPEDIPTLYVHDVHTLDAAPSTFLTKSELTHFQTVSLAKKQQWLGGRFAVKHALAHFVQKQKGTLFSFLSFEIIYAPGTRPSVHTWVPGIPETSLSITHSGPHAVAGVIDVRRGSIGIDLEYPRILKEETLQAFLTINEYAQIQYMPNQKKMIHAMLLWSLKEAYLKALGVGLLVHPRRIEILPYLSHTERTITAVRHDGVLRPIQGSWTRLMDDGILTCIIVPQ